VATIDDKVVAISFESSKFEQGVNRTISALDKLKAALHFPTAGKGLEDLDRAAKKVDFGLLAKGIESVKAALSALRLVGIGVLTHLANLAVDAGGRFVKAFTLDPIKAGFSEYTTNLNAVQTILANTQAAGVGLKEVNATLKELNEYSDKTIYNFSQMAKNIGTFTAAGVDLGTATASIKGIANLAALSGSSAEQASTAMYQLSQAIAAGRVSLMDWNSVVNAGMGGTVFQRALAQTAEAMGTLKDGTVKLVGPMKNVQIAGESFRQSLQAGPGKASWLTSEVLTKTLQQFTGDLSDAELAAMGFNDAQIAAIQQTAQTAMHAATEVKTLGQVFAVAKETAGSGWAQTFQIIFGTFTEAKTTFTALSNAINGFINTNADARNKVLEDWKALGGRTVLIDSIKTAFHNLGLIIAPIKEAFRDIFPAKTGKDLYNLTLRFRDFANALKPSEETVANLKRTFAGLFAVFSIIGQIISGVVGVFARLFGVVGEGSGSFLNFTGTIGDFLVSVDKAMKKGDGLNKFFDGLGDILEIPIRLIGELADALGNLFGGFSSGGFSEQMDGMTKSMTPFQRIMEGISTAWDKFVDSISDVDLGPAIEAIASAIQGLSAAFAEAASNMNFEAILQVIRTGLFAGLILMLKNFFGKGSFLEQVSKGFAGGIIGNIAGSFKALEGSMVAMQQNIKAKTLKEIAIAIALLAASVVALSFVDPAKLNAALGAIAVMMAELLGAMAVLNKIAATGGFIKLPIIAAGLILLAGAIDILAIAVFALSRLSWEELLKGLGGVGALLAGLSGASIVLSANSGGMIRAGIGITAIAVAMNLLALAVKQFAGLSWQELAKGLVGVAGGLVVIAGAMQVMPKGMILQSAALIGLAVGLKILASAVAQFAGMDWGSIAKGLASIGGALVVIAGAMHLMPKGMVLQAAALLILAFALGKIAEAVQSMGGMSLGEIARGLGTLAGSLAILAAALYLMSGAIGGAAALGVAAAGLALLVPAIVALGGMSWGQILKGLVTLAAALTIIGIAGVLITPAIPALLGLGAALVLIGAGLALAGAGIFLISAGLSALIVALPTGVGVLLTALTELQEGLIENVKLFVLGLLQIVEAFAATAPQFVDAIVKILSSVIDGIIQLTPKIAEAFNALIPMILGVIAANQDQIIQAGFNLILALLQGLSENIPAIVAVVVDIITNLLSAIANNLSRIYAAGAQILVSILKGIASGISGVTTAALNIITRFLAAIASGLGRVATAAVSIVTRFISAIAGQIGNVIRAGTNLLVQFITGIGNAVPRIVTAATNAIIKFINAIAQASVKLVDAGFKAIIFFLNGVADAINANAGEMRAAGRRVGVAIIDGMTGGLLSKAGDLYSKLEGVMSKAMSIMHKIPGVDSPSRVTHTIGEWIVEGLVNGIDEKAPEAYKSAERLAAEFLRRMNAIFKASNYGGNKGLKELGRFVTKEFADGLLGFPEEINKVFKDLNEKLTSSMTTARKTIAEEKKKIAEMHKAGDDGSEAMKKAQKVLEQNEILLAKSTASHKLLTQGLKAQRTELLGVAKDYQTVSEKLKAAQDLLIELERTREANITKFTEQYGKLPDIEKSTEDKPIDILGTYMEALRVQTAAVAAYSSTLQQLRELGLDDETYNKLLEEGPEAQAFATQLLSGGKTAVESLNTLDKELKTQSKSLATAAATNLYNAGADAAKGLISGLKSQKAALIREMEDMADDIVKAFNRRLKIKSPSEVFAEIGKFAMQGMAKGMSDSSRVVADAADQAAQNAIVAMKKSLRDISGAVLNELNPNPVITPILDLTQVRAQAGELGALTQVTPISAAASFGQASLISAEQTAARSEEVAVSPAGTSVKFEQNNYSPEALTEIEIYRQTKNQLSQLRSALSLT
jgi:tape measure domain-containing protein